MSAPDRLTGLTGHIYDRLRQEGVLAWQRAQDWHTAGRLPDSTTRGGGLAGALTDDTLRDRLEDRLAGCYHDELRTLEARITADLLRLDRVMNILLPASPRPVGTRDMLAAQVAADGWCISCWRDNQHLQPIQKGPDGHPYYRDRCRACGQWHREHGEDPPMDVLRIRHRGGRVRVRAS